MCYKKIIPCLDVYNGQVVKGVNFVDLVNIGDPVEHAKFYSEAKADELVFLDITATADDRTVLVDLIKKVAATVSIPLTVGGGIRSVLDAGKVLDAGASKVSVNSAAVKNPGLIQEISRNFGNSSLIVAIDVGKTVDNRYVVTINGGKKMTEIDPLEWAVEVERLGAGGLLLTSMEKDGMKTGFDIDITKVISETVSIPVTASGGAGSCEDFYEVFKKTNAAAALAASLFHYKEVSIPELKQYLMDKEIPVVF